MTIDLNIVLGIMAPVVTVVGLIFANSATKKQIVAETEKLKQKVVSDKMEDVPYDLLILFKEVKNGTSKDVIDKYDSTMTKIFTYGLPNAITLASTMQQRNYTNNDPTKPQSEEDKLLTLVYLVLLVVQIKLDLTAVITSPIEWFKLKLTDFSTKQDLEKTIVEKINMVVTLHGLDKRFMVN